jgi:hypothetical protein
MMLHELTWYYIKLQDVGVADAENAPGNHFTQILKNEDHFPTTVSHGQSESVIQKKDD